MKWTVPPLQLRVGTPCHALYTACFITHPILEDLRLFFFLAINNGQSASRPARPNSEGMSLMEPVLAAWLSWGGGFKGNLVAEAMAASIQCYAAGGSANNGEFGLDSRRPRMYEPCRRSMYLPYTKSRKNERAERGGETRRGEEKRGTTRKKSARYWNRWHGRDHRKRAKKPKSPNPPPHPLALFRGNGRENSGSQCGAVSSLWPGLVVVSCPCRDGEAKAGKAERQKRKHQGLKDKRRLGTEPASTVWSPKKRPRTQDPRAGAQRHGSSVALANVARERAAHADEKKGRSTTSQVALLRIFSAERAFVPACDAPPSRLCNSD